MDATADGRGVQSAMKMTWRLAFDLIHSVRNVLGADSHELDSAVIQLAELRLPTNKLMDELSIEEGHLVKWFRENRDQIVNGHLGLQVDYKSKLVQRKNVANVRVDLSGKPVAWLLFAALFEAADKGVMTKQLDNMLKNSERDADCRRQAIQSLKTDLIALKVKIPSAQQTHCYVLIDDQKR